MKFLADQDVYAKTVGLLRELRKASIHGQTGFFVTAQLNTEPALRYHTAEAGSGFVERAQGIIKTARLQAAPVLGLPDRFLLLGLIN